MIAGAATEAHPAHDTTGVGVEFESVSKWFRPKGGKADVHALDDVSFKVNAGEFVSVIGPSGCGKSTLLRIAHGLAAADAGSARVNGTEVHSPSPRCAMVFQGVNLFPWRTALRNVEFGLEMRGVPGSERRQRARTLLELTGLAAFEESFPGQLSGGMQQRVGLARALAVDPDVLFMDEPFGALDAQTKVLMQAELDRIVCEFGKTVIFVTHDMEEAVFLSDRIIVMSARPGSLLADVKVDLPRPRNDGLRKSATFGEYKDHIWELLRTQQELSVSGQAGSGGANDGH